MDEHRWHVKIPGQESVIFDCLDHVAGKWTAGSEGKDCRSAIKLSVENAAPFNLFCAYDHRSLLHTLLGQI
jgi:hypothetical protein